MPGGLIQTVAVLQQVLETGPFGAEVVRRRRQRQRWRSTLRESRALLAVAKARNAQKAIKQAEDAIAAVKEEQQQEMKDRRSGKAKALRAKLRNTTPEEERANPHSYEQSVHRFIVRTCEWLLPILLPALSRCFRANGNFLCAVSEQAAVNNFLTMLGALLHDEFGSGEEEEEEDDVTDDPVQKALRGDSPDAPQLLVSLGLSASKMRKTQDSKKRSGGP